MHPAPRPRTSRLTIGFTLTLGLGLGATGLALAGPALAADPTPTAVVGGDAGPGCPYSAWYPDVTYTPGQTAAYRNIIYTARTTTRGEVPGTGSSWSATQSCPDRLDPTPTSTTPVPTTTVPTTTVPTTTVPATAPWSATTVYRGGERVTYGGAAYRARWWTLGEKPGVDPFGPWVPEPVFAAS
ncbi:carbohydrate-binding protein [Luteimicrobium subarcticum]|uniref:Carbohydrate binding protein n=1 Tax=Luteimicrobium subarcticum TaxID=620910 RepID=A0A2M8WV33_9MICO|nr:carbohydrate-binding protein [Luteimicrobium subarcticum]PJI94778.1 carbohydrate binding protein [Luteimicrobium subarcticum]